MKSKLFFLVLTIYCTQAYTQVYCDNYCLSFEDTSCLQQLSIDTSAGTIWQTGRSYKSVIDSAYYSAHMIITDTLNSYPVNNHSVFTITNVASFGDIYGIKIFSGHYYVHSDSINDYGLIEFSPDNGKTWVDLINDTVFGASIVWYSNIPVLTGKSGGWRNFEVLLSDNGSVFNMKLGDTIKYRFTFISDSIYDNRDGLAFDDICFFDFIEGISETRFTSIRSKLYPNPVSSDFTIEFDNEKNGQFELAVYTIKSELVMSRSAFTGDQIKLSSDKLKPGIYIYKLTNLREKKRSWGKFVIAR